MKRIALALAAVLISVYSFAREYSFDKDIPYISTYDGYLDKMCRLDVAYEEGGENRPVIVWFHGGGLTSGHRSCPKKLQRDGAVVVGVGYPFATEVELPEILDAAAAAVAWVKDNAARYGGDISKVYLAGHSAGGYIVNMLALDRHYLEKYGINPDHDIAAAIPYSGQVITHFAQRRKQNIPELTPTIDSLAPLFHVRGDAAPLLVISGDPEMELYGRYEETAYFVRMMKLNGHKDIVFRRLDGFGHGDMVEPGHLLLLKYIRTRNEN